MLACYVQAQKSNPLPLPLPFSPPFSSPARRLQNFCKGGLPVTSLLAVLMVALRKHGSFPLLFLPPPLLCAGLRLGPGSSRHVCVLSLLLLPFSSEASQGGQSLFLFPFPPSPFSPPSPVAAEKASTTCALGAPKRKPAHSFLFSS